jgi:hypothetical protein
MKMKSFSSSDNKDRKQWGYAFKWTGNHLSETEIKQLRAHHDQLRPSALEKLQKIVAKNRPNPGDGAPLPMRTDIYSVLRDHRGNDIVLQEL